VLGLISCLFLGINPLGKKGVRKWLLFRGLVTSGGLFLFFYSLTKLPILDATGKSHLMSITEVVVLTLYFTSVIFFLGPVFTLMVASVFLNEHFSAKEGFFSVLCFLGVLLISKPGFLFQDPAESQKTELGRFFAVACALGGAIMSAMGYISAKKVGQGTHVLVHIVYFGLVASIASPIVIILSNREFVLPDSSNWDDISKLSFVGLFSFIGQPLLNEGLKLAPRGPGTYLKSTH
jgi:drug/metabolite transporter (DMT)-like permease